MLKWTSRGTLEHTDMVYPPGVKRPEPHCAARAESPPSLGSQIAERSAFTTHLNNTRVPPSQTDRRRTPQIHRKRDIESSINLPAPRYNSTELPFSRTSAPSSPSKSEAMRMPAENFSRYKTRSRSLPPSPQGSLTSETRNSEESKKKGVLTKFKSIFRKSSSKTKDKKITPKLSSSQHTGLSSPVLARKHIKPSTASGEYEKGQVDVLIEPKSRLTRLIESKKEQRKSSRVPHEFQLLKTSPSRAIGTHDLLSTSSPEDGHFVGTFYEANCANYVDQFLFLPPGTSDVSSITTPEEVDSPDDKHVQLKPLSRHRVRRSDDSENVYFNTGNAGIPPRCPKNREALRRSTSLKPDIGGPESCPYITSLSTNRSTSGLKDWGVNSQDRKQLGQSLPDRNSASRNLNSLEDTPSRSELSLLECGESLVTTDKRQSTRVKVMPSQIDEIVQVKNSLIPTNRNTLLTSKEKPPHMAVSPQGSAKSQTFLWSLAHDGGLVISPKTEADETDKNRSPESPLGKFTRNNNNGHRALAEAEMQTSLTEIMPLGQGSSCDMGFIREEINGTKGQVNPYWGSENDTKDSARIEDKVTSASSTPVVSQFNLSEMQGLLLSSRPRVRDIISNIERSPERSEAISIVSCSRDKPVKSSESENDVKVQTKHSKHTLQILVNKRISCAPQGKKSDTPQKILLATENQRALSDKPLVHTLMCARAAANSGVDAQVHSAVEPQLRICNENQVPGKIDGDKKALFWAHSDLIRHDSACTETEKAEKTEMSGMTCTKYLSGEVQRTVHQNFFVSDEKTSQDMASHPHEQIENNFEVDMAKSIAVFDSTADSDGINRSIPTIQQTHASGTTQNVEDMDSPSDHRSSPSPMKKDGNSSELKFFETSTNDMPILMKQVLQNDGSRQDSRVTHEETIIQAVGKIHYGQKIEHESNTYHTTCNSELPTIIAPANSQESKVSTQDPVHTSPKTVVFCLESGYNESAIVSECSPILSPALSHKSISNPIAVHSSPSLVPAHLGLSINKPVLCQSCPTLLGDLYKSHFGGCYLTTVSPDKVAVNWAKQTFCPDTKSVVADTVAVSVSQMSPTQVCGYKKISTCIHHSDLNVVKSNQIPTSPPANLAIPHMGLSAHGEPEHRSQEMSNDQIDTASVEADSLETSHRTDNHQSEPPSGANRAKETVTLTTQTITSPKISLEDQFPHDNDEGITDVRAPVSMVMQDSSTLEEVHDHHLDLLAIKNWETFFSLNGMESQRQMETSTTTECRTPSPTIRKRDTKVILHNDLQVDNTAMFDMPSCALQEFDFKVRYDSESLKNKKKVSFAIDTTSPENSSKSDDRAVIEPTPCLAVTEISKDGPGGTLTDPKDTASSTDLSGSFSGRSNEIPGMTPQITSTSADDVSWWGPEVIEGIEFLHDQSLAGDSAKPEPLTGPVTPSDSAMTNTPDDHDRHVELSQKSFEHPIELLTLSTFLSGEIKDAGFEADWAKTGSQDVTRGNNYSERQTADDTPLTVALYKSAISDNGFGQASDQENTYYDAESEVAQVQGKKDFSDTQSIYAVQDEVEEKEKEARSVLKTKSDSSEQPEQKNEDCEVSQEGRSSPSSADSHTYNVSPKVLKEQKSRFPWWEMPEVTYGTKSSQQPLAEWETSSDESEARVQESNPAISEASDETWILTRRHKNMTKVIEEARPEHKRLKKKSIHGKKCRTLARNMKYTSPNWQISSKPTTKVKTSGEQEPNQDERCMQIKKELEYPSTGESGTEMKRKRRMRDIAGKRKRKAMSPHDDGYISLQNERLKNNEIGERKSSYRLSPSTRTLSGTNQKTVDMDMITQQRPFQPLINKQQLPSNDFSKQDQVSEDSYRGHILKSSASPLSFQQTVPARKHRWYREQKRIPENSGFGAPCLPEADHRYCATVGPMTQLRNGLKPPQEDQSGSGDPGESSEETSFDTRKDSLYHMSIHCRDSQCPSQRTLSSFYTWPMQSSNQHLHNGPSHTTVYRQTTEKTRSPDSPFHGEQHVVPKLVSASPSDDSDGQFVWNDSVCEDSSWMHTFICSSKTHNAFDRSKPEQHGFHHIIHPDIRHRSKEISDSTGRLAQQHRNQQLPRDLPLQAVHQENIRLQSLSKHWQQLPRQQRFQQQQQQRYQQQSQQKRLQRAQYSDYGGSDAHAHQDLPQDRGHPYENPLQTDPSRHLAISRTAGSMKSRLDSQPDQWLFIATFFVFQLFLHWIYAR